MKKEFTDANHNIMKIDSQEKSIFLNYDDTEQPKFVFRHPKDMIEFAAAINIIANRWIANIPDEIYDSFRLEK